MSATFHRSVRVCRLARQPGWRARSEAGAGQPCRGLRLRPPSRAAAVIRRPLLSPARAPPPSEDTSRPPSCGQRLGGTSRMPFRPILLVWRPACPPPCEARLRTLLASVPEVTPPLLSLPSRGRGCASSAPPSAPRRPPAPGPLCSPRLRLRSSFCLKGQESLKRPRKLAHVTTQTHLSMGRTAFSVSPPRP